MFSLKVNRQVFKGFLVKELTQMIRNPIMVFALLVMPVVQCFLLSYAVSNEARNLSIVVSAPASDVAMRRILTQCTASDLFVPAKGDGRIDVELDPFDWVMANKADVVLVAPPGGLTKALRDGSGAKVQALIDASNVLTAQAVSGFLRAIINNVVLQDLTGNSSETVSGEAARQANASSSINFITRILFNPEMNTKFFLVPSIMAMVVATALFSLVCISITKEKENGTIETLISAPIEKMDIILGKTLPFFIIGFTNFASVCLLGIIAFHLPLRGSLIMMLGSFLSFGFAMASLGIFVANFCENQQQALLSIMMSMLVLMLLSGTMFPVETMPKILKMLAYANPITHFNYLSRNLVLKGCGWSYFFLHNYPMVLFGLVFGFLGVRQFKQTI